jgi:biopolymer transport protein ExbD
VLITYLLVSASFLSLSVLEVGVAATGEAPPPALIDTPPEPPIAVAVEMKQATGFEIKVTGGPKNLAISYPIPTLDLLRVKLAEVMKYWPTVTDISVSAEPTVRYKEMIKLIEQLHSVTPKIYLAGT